MQIETVDEPVVPDAGPDMRVRVGQAPGDVFGCLHRDDVVGVAVEHVEMLVHVAELEPQSHCASVISYTYSSSCTMPWVVPPSVREQQAVGRLAGSRAVGWSGGSEPSTEVNPAAVEAMREVGIDVSTEFPKPWTDEILRAADVVVTMGCGDACPIFPGKRYEDCELDDPEGKDVEALRPIRDEIGERVRGLLASLEVPVG